MLKFLYMGFRFSIRLFSLSLLFIFIALEETNAIEVNNLEEKLKRHIKVLSSDIGERNFIVYPNNLEQAAEYIKEELENIGYAVSQQDYLSLNRAYRNIIATKVGKDKKDKIIIVGAHYDTVSGSPGADDNASGVAGLLALAELLYKEELNKTLKFIAFTNEEPPLFMTQDMGSLRYAREARSRGEDIEAMLCLESIGYFREEKGSQNYPLGLSIFYPDRGNFIAMAANFTSASLLKKMVKQFNAKSTFPVEHLIAPIFFTPAISFSDNWSFWKMGYKAVMITDTAFYRNPYYHTCEDTLEKIDYKSMAEVIKGLYAILLEFCN